MALNKKRIKTLFIIIISVFYFTFSPFVTKRFYTREKRHKPFCARAVVYFNKTYFFPSRFYLVSLVFGVFNVSPTRFSTRQKGRTILSLAPKTTEFHYLLLLLLLFFYIYNKDIIRYMLYIKEHCIMKETRSNYFHCTLVAYLLYPSLTYCVCGF